MHSRQRTNLLEGVGCSLKKERATRITTSSLGLWHCDIQATRILCLRSFLAVLDPLSLFNRNSTCFSEVFNLRFKLLLAAYSTQIARVISCGSCDFRLGTCVPVSNPQISVSLPMLYSRISALQPCALHVSLYAGHRLRCRIVHCSPMSFLFTAAYTSYRFVSFRIHNNASRQRRGLRTSCALMRVNSLVWR